ncbi:hypothetical protein QUF70_02430 [Desulfobacterales bacterium HSG17]|nr:hypothetical protein [Desulfobacterales bacterium HSG17]
MFKSLLKILLFPFKLVFSVVEIFFTALFKLLKNIYVIFVCIFKFSIVVLVLGAISFGILSYFKDAELIKKYIPQKQKQEKITKIVREDTKGLNKNEYYFRTFEFADNSRNRYKIEHAISKSHVEESEESYGRSKSKLRSAIKKKAEDYNQRYSGKSKVKLQNGLRYSINYDRKHKYLVKQFEEAYKQILKDYYEKNKILLKNNVISPDYRAIQKWQADFVESLYRKLKQLAQKNNMNEREFVILMARFVQHLKYKIPPEPGNKNIIGFWPPVICLKEKSGDCDSKSTLFASIFYHYKKDSCILLLTKKHAFIGIKNQHKRFPTDKTVKIGGVDYLLLETTAVWRLGNVSKKDLNQLKRRQFKYIHFN